MTRTNARTTMIVATLLWAGWSGVGHQPSAQPSGSGQPPANLSTVTKQQFDQWMTQLSNWGRWGKDDERGALNLITAEKRRQAATLAKTGTIVSLAREIVAEKPAGAPQPRPVNRGGAAASVFLIDGDYLYERQEIEYHGGRLSHFDALCHVSHNGKLYNGLNFKDVVSEKGGCSKLSVLSAQDGIVTRGVLLDLPGTRVRPEDVQAWEKRTGIKISRGDALLLRSRRPGAPPAGLVAPAMIPLSYRSSRSAISHCSATTPRRKAVRFRAWPYRFTPSRLWRSA